MDQLKALSRAKQIILGAAVLLLVSTFFAWQSVEFGGVELASQNAWHGFWGVLLGLLTIAMIAWIVAGAMGVDLADALPDGVTTLALGAAIFVFALLKNLTDDYSAWGSYVGVILAALVALGAWMHFQESGEELPGTKSSTAAPAAASSSAPPPEPPAAPPVDEQAPPPSGGQPA